MANRALISVWDKTGLIDFARGLAALGLELVASGGSAKALADAGLAVTQVDDITGHPEILGGRVKTLHPVVHGGILARPTPEHLGELATHGIVPIDVVVCNLYPFQATISKPGITELEAIEQIDIGGVTLLRAAAKNHERVAIVCDPADYSAVLEGLKGGADDAFRKRLALKAFQHTATYDTAISIWLQTRIEGEQDLPNVLALRATKVSSLRYGENSHQQGAVYAFEGQKPGFELLGGDKELSYNNVADLEAAWAMPQEFDRPAVAIIKHMNPSGLAVADDLITAFDRALACDPISAFGGIIATNRPVDLAFVERLGKLFVEVIAAPDVTPDALAFLAEKKKNCRVVRCTGEGKPKLVVSAIHGGLLVQTPDDLKATPSTWRVVTQRAPTPAELADLAFAEIACKHVKSNAIVFAKGEATVGVGSGQMNRADSVRIGAFRAGVERSTGSVLASDAFFPFADGLEEAAKAGITAVCQPGGSVRDDEVIAAADRLGLAMVFTGVRHFRH